MRKYFILITLTLLISWNSMSQNIRDSVISISMLSIDYGLQFPGGDLVNRFGISSSVGASFKYKTNKNWLWSTNASYLFGSDIKNKNIFGSIATSEGDLIDGNGMIADIRLFERGYQAGINIGKVISWKKPNPNTGLLVSAGVGFLQHKIRIENKENTALQIAGDYKKGYDLLTNGASINEFIGYQYLGNSRLFNFYIGIESTQAFTKCRRSYNFATMSTDNTQRLDILTSIKIGWILSLYKRMPEKYYIN